MKRKYIPSLQKDKDNIVTGYRKGGEQCENFSNGIRRRIGRFSR